MGDDFPANGPYRGKNGMVNDEYAYADITEEFGRGYNENRLIRGGREYTGPRFNEPIFHQPGHRVYPQGPVITTPSMEMQPVPSRHVSFDHYPQYPPAYTQYPHVTRYPGNERTSKQCDLFLLFAGIFVLIFCPPIGWPAGIFAIICVFQAPDHDMRGHFEEGHRARMISAGSSMCGILVGGGLTVGAVIYTVIYNSNK